MKAKPILTILMSFLVLIFLVAPMAVAQVQTETQTMVSSNPSPYCGCPDAEKDGGTAGGDSRTGGSIDTPG